MSLTTPLMTNKPLAGAQFASTFAHRTNSRRVLRTVKPSCVRCAIARPPRRPTGGHTPGRNPNSSLSLRVSNRHHESCFSAPLPPPSWGRGETHLRAGLTISLDPFGYKATLVATFMLFIKMQLTNIALGYSKFQTGSRGPEDAMLTKFFPGSLQKDLSQNFGIRSTAEKGLVESQRRWARIVGNDLENIPIGLLCLWAALLTAKSPAVHVFCVATFVIARTIFSLFYHLKLQPHRTVAWTVGNLSIVSAMLNALAGALL
eukprot:CAMPEP_0198213302 /NCGR_PEP_ID=MMETSP1445-20131203/28792_1 /TAXON_ID=36898 /ORGANISM="Pyramimonas sp., Strain CCMP2087" /LENGTH=259 /DNA_ID=CAMNT_0043887927 /DNA_START=105 /DNA_END=884 /DNA_ORIENTATION=+